MKTRRSCWLQVAWTIPLVAAAPAFGQAAEQGRDDEEETELCEPCPPTPCPPPAPTPVRRSHPGWISGWPRIPDLPQVRSKIPFTNRPVSRGEAERRAAQAGDPKRPDPEPAPTAVDQNDRIRRLRAAALQRDAEAARGAEESRRAREFDREGPEDRAPDGAALRGTHPAGFDPALGPAPPPPPTVLERADMYLAAGDYGGAADQYLLHLNAEPGDARAVRSLAIALLLGERPHQASNELLRAYRLEPALAARPLDPSVLGAAAPARQVMQRAVTFANRSRTPGAWLTAAILAQAQGRRDVSARFVERAREAGLEPEVTDPLITALAREEKPHAQGK